MTGPHQLLQANPTHGLQSEADSESSLYNEVMNLRYNLSYAPKLWPSQRPLELLRALRVHNSIKAEFKIPTILG